MRATPDSAAAGPDADAADAADAADVADVADTADTVRFRRCDVEPPVPMSAAVVTVSR